MVIYLIPRGLVLGLEKNFGKELGLIICVQSFCPWRSGWSLSESVSLAGSVSIFMTWPNVHSGLRELKIQQAEQHSQKRKIKGAKLGTGVQKTWGGRVETEILSWELHNDGWARFPPAPKILSTGSHLGTTFWKWLGFGLHPKHANLSAETSKRLSPEWIQQWPASTWVPPSCNRKLG